MACIDPQVHPGIIRKLTILEITAIAVSIILLVLATTLEEGKLTTALLGGGSGLAFIIGIALDSARRASKQLDQPIDHLDVTLAIKQQSGKGIKRLRRLRKLTNQHTLREGVKGTSLHLFAETNTLTDPKKIKAQVREFLKAGVEINATEKGKGNTALHIAMERNDVPLAEVLIELGADRSIRNNSHCTPEYTETTDDE